MVGNNLILLTCGMLWLVSCIPTAHARVSEPSVGSAATAQASPPPAVATVVNGSGDTNAEAAFTRLQDEEPPAVLFLVDQNSTGIAGDIYRDLVHRNFRATTGPDEGIDTHSLACYPRCLFVLKAAANAIGVEAWTNVLRHEYRHITQAMNNPQLAQDYRDANGRFTTYAAFSEACADDGLNVAPDYQARQRLGALRATLDDTQQALIEKACTGDKAAYNALVQVYNQSKRTDSAFSTLFPPYD